MNEQFAGLAVNIMNAYGKPAMDVEPGVMSDEQIESWASEFDEAGFPEIGEKMRKVLRAATVLETERMKQIPKEKAYSMSFKQDGYYDFGGNFIPYSKDPPSS